MMRYCAAGEAGATDDSTKAVEALGHEALILDLYRLQFDPCLHAEEIPRPSGFSALEEVDKERALIRNADVFVFVYPLWFNVRPQ